MNALTNLWLACLLATPAQQPTAVETNPAEPPMSDSATETDSATDAQRSFGVTEPTATADAVSRIATSLNDAQRELSQGRTGDAAQAAQRTAIDELARLIEAAKSAKSEQRPQDSQASSSGEPRNDGSPMTGSATDQAGTSASDPAANPSAPGDRSAKADAPDERAAVPPGSDAFVRDLRANMVRDAWGHLPARLRDQILNTGSESYLPRYDSLVRSYFESLAQPNPADRPSSRSSNGE